MGAGQDSRPKPSLSTRTSYITGESSAKRKCRAPCSKMTKNFQLIAGHSTKLGPFEQFTGRTPMKSAVRFVPVAGTAALGLCRANQVLPVAPSSPHPKGAARRQAFPHCLRRKLVLPARNESAADGAICQQITPRQHEMVARIRGFESRLFGPPIPTTLGNVMSPFCSLESSFGKRG